MTEQQEGLANIFDTLGTKNHNQEPNNSTKSKNKKRESKAQNQQAKTEIKKEANTPDKNEEESHIEKLFAEREKRKKPKKKPEGFLTDVRYLEAINMLSKKYGYGYKQAFANEAFKNQLQTELARPENKKIKEKLKQKGIEI